MAQLKFATDLFLEKAELKRFLKFIDEKGFRQFSSFNSDTYGLVKKEKASFQNGFIQEDSRISNIPTIQHTEIFAVNNALNVIYKPATQQIELPNVDIWYWVKVAYLSENIEKGTFSIDSDGNLTCTSGDAELLDILRGQPNFPSRVAFVNASNNTLEYDVEDVVDNNNAILTGSFVSESNLKLAIVGTFTAGSNPDSGDKYPFQYDSCTLSFVEESVLETAPSKTANAEFWLARVKVDATTNPALPTIEIQDKRSEFWKSTADYFNSSIDRNDNPVIGIESLNFNQDNTTKDKNIVQVGWGFRSDSFSTNSNLNKVSISSGLGGKFKTTNFIDQFTNGDFNGWRLYVSTGDYFKITSSTKTGSSIDLVFENVDLKKVVDSTQIIVCPDVEEIELIFTTPAATDGNRIVEERHIQPINIGFARIPLTVYKNGCSYTLTYRYKHDAEYSNLKYLPTDDVGYYPESQFDIYGDLIPSPVRVPYEGGSFTLALHSSAYITVITNLLTGDKYGVNETSFDNGTPVVQLITKQSFQYQRFSGSPLSLSTNIYINLNKFFDSPTNSLACRNGNNFVIHIKQKIELNAFSLNITQDYVNSGAPGTIIKTLSAKDIFFLNNSEEGLFFNCTYDGTNWIVNNVNESKFVNTNYIDKSHVSPALSPGAGGSITYSPVDTLTAVPYKLKKAFIVINAEFITSNGGGGALGTVAAAIKINGGSIGANARAKIMPSELFLNAYNINECFAWYIGDLNKDDVIEVQIGTAAAFTPMITINNVDTMLTGEIDTY